MSPTAMWTALQDPDNRENKNAGNGGDIVKHTVYLTVLEHLLSHTPWRERLRVRECHAGRGMYSIPVRDRRRSMLARLYKPVDADDGVPLHDLQRVSQQALGVWPADPTSLGWYAGSAVLNAHRLAAAPGKHLIEFYEMYPDTRSILRTVLAAFGLDASCLESRVLPPDGDDGRLFDGERYVVTNIGRWNFRDLVLLDPFAMSRQACHQAQRDRYGRIVDTVIAKGQKSPLLVFFWTWGHAFRAADGDLQDTNPRVPNGYQDLRARLLKAGRYLISITWRWDLQFAMWVLVPDSQRHGLTAALRQRCHEVRDHLPRSRDLPGVEVRLEGRGPESAP